MQIPAMGQNNNIATRLSAERLGGIAPGQYQAGDRVNFVLFDDGSRYLLKIAPGNEVFVLTADRGSAGGRILKYDSGAMALQVASFGAITLYPDDAPNGLPAERTGDAPKPVPDLVSLTQMQTTADNVGRNLKVVIAANWDYFAADTAARAIGQEALENAEAGITRFIAQRGRAAFAQSVETIRLEPNMSPRLMMAGKTLMIGLNQAQGFAGRLSSRNVAQTLNGLIPK